MQSKCKGVLLFVHGFLGSAESFARFPEHLEARLDLHGFECKVLPAFDCKHTLAEAARRAVVYILDLVPPVAADEDGSNGAAPPRLDLILVAHSMGGLVAADAVRILTDATHPLHETTAAGVDPSAIRVLGLLAFDTPYFHLQPELLNLAHRPLVSVVQVMMAPVSLWRKAVALAAPAVLGAGFAHFLSNYITFLAPLFGESLARRVERLQYLLDTGVRVQCLYPKIRRRPPDASTDATTAAAPSSFVYIPRDLPPHITALFRPIPTTCSNPIEAHTHIFDATLDPASYGKLVVDVVALVESWLALPLEIEPVD
ncbi:hypothetical protein H9P43_008734 [Blastocladiella emersonii ATCC 22665]|nr:hypothetical protein H9P43_008734 [Blastocladiella emersonii ATCC 22665]